MPCWWHPLGHRNSPKTLPIKLFKCTFKRTQNVHNLRGDGIIFGQTFVWWNDLKTNSDTNPDTFPLSPSLPCRCASPLPEPLSFYPRYFHVFMSVFPFSSPLWWLVFAARNYPENILKLYPPRPCTSWDGQLLTDGTFHDEQAGFQGDGRFILHQTLSFPLSDLSED